MQEEGWNGKKLWDKFSDIYFVFASSIPAAICCYGYIC